MQTAIETPVWCGLVRSKGSTTAMSGGLLIPESLVKQLEKERQARDEEKKYALSNSQKYLKESIRQHLGLLRRELGHYEQTTHAVMLLGEVGLETILELLRTCYKEPTAYNISNLDQYLDAWLKQLEQP